MKTMEERILEQINAAKEVQAISFVALTESGQIEADVATAHRDLFADWQPSTFYKVGQIRKYNGALYKIVQDHTSQSDWAPGSTPSLYKSIELTESGYPVWNKPTGAHDAYNTGDIVEYNGKLYKSLIDGNVYSPDEYSVGWEEVVE